MSILNAKKHFITLFILISLVYTGQAFASGEFQNNLLNANLAKNYSGGLSLNLYTSKPYSEPLTVNKKSDNEYVILLPETSSSLFSTPSFKAASDVVKNVVVKTQQYNNNMKGYTKIIVSTQKAVDIIPHISTVKQSDYQLRDKDVKDLIAKASGQKQKTVVTKKPSENKSTQNASKPAQTAIVKGNKTVTKTANKPIQNVIVDKIKQGAKLLAPKNNKSSQNVAKNANEKQKVQQKTVKTAPLAKSSTSANSQSQKPVQAKVPAQTVQEFAKSKETSNALSSREEKMVNTSPKIKPSVDMTLKNKTAEPPKKGMIKNSILFGVGAILAALILLISIAKKIAKNIHKNKEVFMNNLKDEPSKATDYTQNINEDMNWKEMYNAYSNSQQDTTENEDLETFSTETTDVENNSENDLGDLFSNINDVENNQDDAEPLFEQNDDESLPFESDINDDVPTYVNNATGEVSTDFDEEIPYRDDDFIDTNITPEQVFADIDEDGDVENIQPPISLYDDSQVLGESDDLAILDDESDVETDLASEFETSQEPYLEEDELSFVEEMFEESQSVILSAPEPEIIKNKIQKEEVVDEKIGDEIIKSEFLIDSDKSFYLVDYQDSTTLVGQINDEIFVLKRFNEKINTKLQARVNEKTSKSTSYMTRVGSFKAIVEVTPDNMKLLIEL